MNPLSAIQPTFVPEWRPLSPPSRTGATAIPASELQQLSPTEFTRSAAPAARSEHTFGSLLGQMVGEVNARQAAAGEAVTGLLSGQNVSLHQAMIAMEEASVSFQLMVEVRNKLLDSYQELMRMQV